MRIGISAPIEVRTLSQFLPNLSDKELQLGLGGTAINHIITGLINKGHHVTVFTLDPTITEKYVLQGNQLKIIFGSFRIGWKKKAFDFCFQEFSQIKRFILEEKENLDIVNAHWSYEFAIGTILAKVPHIVTFRDDSPSILRLTKHFYRATRLLMDFWVRRSAKAFSYNSEYLKNLINLEGYVIPNPVCFPENMKAKTFPGLSKPFNIFFIANGWDNRKNPEVAIRAFSLLRKRYTNINLHLIGSGFEVQSPGHLKMKSQVNLDGVHFRGKMKFVELLDQYKQCDLMLHTAKEESFGNNLVEAMANGIPVIAGENAGAVPWVLDYGKAGALVNVESIESVAKAINKFLTDKEYFEKLSKAGLNNVQSRFSIEVVTEQYLTAYRKQIDLQKT
jgi:glycosyltransferase involved in cell wall biosynthesis